MKPYFADDQVQLYHGDAREVLVALFYTGQRADLLLTDCPYGISKEGANGRGPKGDRKRDFGDWDRDPRRACALAEEVASRSRHVLADHAPVYWYCGHIVFGRLEEFYRADGWETRMACWWKPAAPGPMPGCFPGGIEPIFHAYREGRTWNGGAHHALIKANAPPRTDDDHPNKKPGKALEPLIAWSSKPGDLVLDPFAGEGSILVAARAMGRRAIGIELDERWCERAAINLSQVQLPFQQPVIREAPKQPALFDAPKEATE